MAGLRVGASTIKPIRARPANVPAAATDSVSQRRRYRALVDIDRLMRLKGVVAATDAEGKGFVKSYARIRGEVAEAVGPEFADELGRLFPADLATAGQPWKAQEQEVKALLAQMTGWLDGMIEAALVDRRIQAEAEAKAK